MLYLVEAENIDGLIPMKDVGKMEDYSATIIEICIGTRWSYSKDALRTIALKTFLYFSSKIIIQICNGWKSRVLK